MQMLNQPLATLFCGLLVLISITVAYPRVHGCSLVKQPDAHIPTGEENVVWVRD